MPTYDIGLEHVSLAFATKTIFTDVTQGVFEGDRIGIGASTFEVRDGWLVSV